MFLIRGALPGDLDALEEVARHLDSVNLPNDRARLAQVIERSDKSFAGKVERSRRELLFVLTDDADKAIGASMIFPQHGSRRAPHTYFDVIDEERYSETLDRHFKHRVLRIGYNYQGMTEIGGLVLLPAYRGHAEELGRSLSYIRFLYIALHRDEFCDEMLSELMPPLEPDGTSLLWEAMGRHFTGLSYQEADRLSRENKEFIHALFPQDPIYASLLPPKAQALIGQVGPNTKRVEQMLLRIGFSYAHRIDPFDGGPHFQARTDDVTAVKTSRRHPVLDIAQVSDGAPALVASESALAPHFRAIRTRITVKPKGVTMDSDAARALAVEVGGSVGVLVL